MPITESDRCRDAGRYPMNPWLIESRSPSAATDTWSTGRCPDPQAAPKRRRISRGVRCGLAGFTKQDHVSSNNAYMGRRNCT